jgi:hypothetical protein
MKKAQSVCGMAATSLRFFVGGSRSTCARRAILPSISDRPAMPKKSAPSKSSKKHSASTSARTSAVVPKSREPVKNLAQAATPEAAPQTTPPAPKSPSPSRESAKRANLSAEAALSFLRDTKGSLSWSLRDLSRTLNISREEAERAVALLQMQGYIQAESGKSGEWITTPSGETVSGAKTPRYDRETVEAALTSLKERIDNTNKDRAAKFQITRAVAFGDFLGEDRARVQAADVGIELSRRDHNRHADTASVGRSAADAREEQWFLREIRGRSTLIDLKSYSDWMGMRTHRNLL